VTAFESRGGFENLNRGVSGMMLREKKLGPIMAHAIVFALSAASLFIASTVAPTNAQQYDWGAYYWQRSALLRDGMTEQEVVQIVGYNLIKSNCAPAAKNPPAGHGPARYIPTAIYIKICA
jgi:hypothetical protein